MVTSLSARARLAILGVRGVNWLSRRSGRGSGTVAGGRVGLRIAPDLLHELAQSRQVVVVTGTNGKTTTAALVATGWGGPVAANATGANMPAGHVAALVASREPRAVLEVDEAWLPEVVARVDPAVVVLLNLSRDQLDRANEVRQMAERWRHCLGDAQSDRVVVANANDPLVVHAASDAKNVWWCDVATTWLGDAQSCPRCTRPIHHTGRGWYCDCGFAKPAAVVTLEGDEVVVRTKRARLDLALPGEFNRANAAMAGAALVGAGGALEASVERMNSLEHVADRFTTRRWRTQTLQLMLAKNPAGFAALLSSLAPGPRDVWIAINAQVADGRDPSWLYDVPFETLRGRRVSCLGERRLDLATRLEYAGVEAVVIDADRELAVVAETVPMIANYTAFRQWAERSTPC